MTRGFVTIATGDLNYYIIARTLLRTYKQNGGTLPFALIADRRNEYTEEFDDVVILDTPTNSWLDKLALLKLSPYSESIFIDADCLIYKNIDFFFDLFAEADDFSCFGSMLPLDSEIGWFKQNEVGSYKIHFITHLHGMLYFIRKSPVTEAFYDLCIDIIENYDQLTFKMFNEKPADEPVFALAMAVMNLKPIDRLPEYYCFVPFATYIHTDYRQRKVSFCNPKDGHVDICHIVHWSSPETKNAQYLLEAKKVDREKAAEGSVFARLVNKFLFDWNLRTLLKAKK